MNKIQKTDYNDIKVYWTYELDGGGSTFGNMFVPLFHILNIPPCERLFEWCSGPGFIGFSLLSYGFCKTLCLADINPKAVKICEYTVKQNNLHDKVSVYHSDNLKNIPKSEKWDIIVSNPPHFDSPELWYKLVEEVDHLKQNREFNSLSVESTALKVYDKNWETHRIFFRDLKEHLNDNGVCILQENNFGSHSSYFCDMIKESGLKTVFVLGEEDELSVKEKFYYIGIMKEEDDPPNWVKSLRGT